MQRDGSELFEDVLPDLQGVRRGQDLFVGTPYLQRPRAERL